MNALSPAAVRAPVGAAVAVLALATAAWVALALGAHDHPGVVPTVEPHSHHGVSRTTPSSGGSGVGAALAGWALMVVAMMLPPALPLVGVLAHLTRTRPRSVVARACGLGAFIGVWVVVGVVLVTGDLVVDRVVAGSADVTIKLAGAVVVVAGLYQFTPAKRACLSACRSPRWFALRFWRGRSAVRESATLALAYGVSCIGCCWALMLLGLGVGALALPIMVVLTVLMTAERLLPVRVVAVLVPAVGVLLVAVGVAVLADAVPAPVIRPFLGV